MKKIIAIVLIITSITTTAFVPISDDPEALVSRRDVIEFFDNLSEKLSTIDKETLIRINDMLTDILKTRKQEEEEKKEQER